MIYEYAIEPALVATWGKLSEYRYFYDKFGLGHPRIMSQYPRLKNWRRQVLIAASEIDGPEKERIIELVKMLSEKMISRDSSVYDGNVPWLENAEKEHEQGPFHAILAVSNPRRHQRVVTGSTLGETHNARWDLKRADRVRRKAHEMAEIIESMLSNCQEVLFIDPHFGPEKGRFRRPLKSFLKCLTRNRSFHTLNRIEVHSKLNSQPEFFYSECERRLTGIIPPGMTVPFRRWRQNQAGEQLHDRYILTNIGGVEFSKGLDDDDNDPVGDRVKVTLLDRDSYNLLWAQYAGPNPAFQLAEEPIAVVGRAERQR